MKKQEINTEFQKRRIETFMKVEIIPDDLLNHPERMNPEYVPYPSADGYAISVNGATLYIEFEASEMDYAFTDDETCDEFIKEGIFCDITQFALDFDYKKYWVENGLVDESLSDEQMESVVFELIKEADEVHEVYFEMRDERMDETYNCKMFIREFLVIDMNSGERIDMLKSKTFAEGCFSENVSI